MIQRSGKVVLKKFRKINKSCIFVSHIEQHISQKTIVNTRSIYKGALNGRERCTVNHYARYYKQNRMYIFSFKTNV